jgi:signal transduction histidine kinase
MEAGLVALILSLLLAWLMARSVARPLQEVAAASRALAQGDLAHRVPVSGPQEVQDLARAFNQMAAQVAASQRAQRDFVANVSHEMKTPLTSIQGFSQAILDGTASDPEAVARAAHVVYDEADRMRRMVDDLLSLARFDADEVEMAREPVDLGALLQRCIARLSPQAAAARDELTLSTEGELIVTGDTDWLTQIFINLLDNAIRHTREGEIGVVARRVEDEIEVTVTDTGEGIPPEALKRIFERFYQADASRQRKGGVGLGLPIVQEVVRRHGGEITVESVVNLGSRFTVRLPAHTG